MSLRSPDMVPRGSHYHVSYHRQVHKVTLLLCTSPVSSISDLGGGLYPSWHYLMDLPLTGAEFALGRREKEQYISVLDVLL